MSERTRRLNKAFMSTKKRACNLIRHYLIHHPTIYVSDDKNFYYEYAIKEAYKEVRMGQDTPINILDQLFTKYDTWAHTGLDSDRTFGVMAAAVDDLIDMILTS